MLSSSSSLFSSLPERPPTPPRDTTHLDSTRAIEDALTFLTEGHTTDERAADRQQHLPSDSPVARSPSSSQSLSTKRVEFSPYPKYHKIARLGQLSSPSSQLFKCTPLNRHAKPVRSILKQSINVLDPLTPDELENQLSYFSPQDPGSFARMVHSALQNLAGPRQNLRLDAYLSLSGAIKAYENTIPDIQAIASKMPILMQFFSRDVAWKTPSGSLDTNMVTQSLKLVVSIMFEAQLVETWDDDFRTFLVDRSITVLENADMSKSIVKMHMYLLANQRFRSSVMTSARIDKILTALQTIEDRCTGHTTVETRLVIYQKLVEQAPAVMMTRSRDWLEDAFHGVLSSIEKIRIRAVSLCQMAGLKLGTQPNGSKALREMFEAEVEEGKTYYDYLHERLVQMISDKETGQYVPQIWLGVILFFRNKRPPLERWPRFKTWLMIIQKCLNSSDMTIKYYANKAWNRLVFVVMPDETTGNVMRTMLRVPVTVGFDRRTNDKYAQQERQIAAETFYNLLHYTLRPGLSHKELDTAWELYVDHVLATRCKTTTHGRHVTCQVVRGLLTPVAGVWNINAANELAPIKPEDLPRMEPRWIRSRLAKVLSLLEPALVDSMWKMPEINEELSATMDALYMSIAEAGNQEVRTSPELKESVAVLVNLLRRLWLEGTQAPPDKAAAFLRRYNQLVSNVIRGVGLVPFAEDILTTTKQDGIEAAFTPSHRPSKRNTAPHSPLLFLFGLLYHPPSSFIAESTQDDFLNLGAKLLELLTSSRQLPVAQIELLSRSMQAWSSLPAIDSPEGVPAFLWTCIGERTTAILETKATQIENHDSQPLGQELRNAVGILTLGFAFASGNPACAHSAFELYQATLTLASSQAGAGGVTLAITEPLAEAMIDMDSSVLVSAKLPIVGHLLVTSAWPRSRQELDQSRKTLWGVGLAPHKASVFEPFDKTYKMLSEFLISSYRNIDVVGEDANRLSEFFESCVEFLNACPASLLATTLREVQSGFVVWIEDSARATAQDEATSTMVQSTWRVLLELLGSLPQHDSTVVKAMEPLLAAGFSSPHRSIVSQTIVFWNQTFGNQVYLDYPSKLRSVLQARSTEADISLPGFSERYANDDLPSLPAFYETQADTTSGQERLRTCAVVSCVANSDPGAKRVSFTAANSPAPTTVSSPTRPSTRSSTHSTPIAWLRHNDSQVQSAPIESSPIRPADQSQHLTKHQQEVLSKQRENSQMFPDLSSSPFAEPSSKGVYKKLDFTSDRVQLDDDEGMGTPLCLPDANNLMSDDIPSSPTPSSNKGSDPARRDIEVEADEDFHDPPSSPPRGAEEDDFEPRPQALDDVAQNNTNMDLTANINSLQDNLIEEEDVPPSPTSQFASDSVLPTAQLQAEAEADEQTAANGAATEIDTALDPPQSNDDFKDAREDDQETVVDTDELAEVTRVEDSFVDPPQLAEDTDSQTPTRRQQKRKRSDDSHSKAAKKHKSQSPFRMVQNFFSSFTRPSQENDNEDIGDEIVVASSQPSYSPVKTPSGAVQSTEEPSQPSQRAKRARPQKSHSQQAAGSSQKGGAPAKQLKRKASVLSISSNVRDEEYEITTVMKDTPALPKTRGQREAARRSQEELPSSKAKIVRRKLASVDIPQEESIIAISESLDAEEKPAVAVEGVLRTRRMATPKSILGRLKDVLADLPKMLLGSQEERQLDDMLFEIRREVHDAAKRSRDE